MPPLVSNVLTSYMPLSIFGHAPLTALLGIEILEPANAPCLRTSRAGQDNQGTSAFHDHPHHAIFSMVTGKPTGGDFCCLGCHKEGRLDAKHLSIKFTLEDILA